MNSEYVIITDATSDVTPAYAEMMDIDVIPMEVNIEGNCFMHYPDEHECSIESFYNQINTGKVAKTTQVSQDYFFKYFENHLAKGRDILYIAFSSGLSGTYQSSLIVADELKEKYPGRKIICVDSLCASAGTFLLIHHIAKNRNSGISIEENAKWIDNNRLKVCHWFTVSDLATLKLGGRISAATALIGTALQIKPVMHVDDNGCLVNVSKARGRKASLKAICDEFYKSFIPDDNDLIIVAHGGAEEDALFLQNLVEEKSGGCKIIIAKIGPVIGAHTGKGVVALFFIGNKR